jgi:hypothetical protein
VNTFAVVVLDILSEQPSQVVLAEYDHVVE